MSIKAGSIYDDIHTTHNSIHRKKERQTQTRQTDAHKYSRQKSAEAAESVRLATNVVAGYNTCSLYFVGSQNTCR